MSVNIEYNSKEIVIEIYTNVLKMLKRRKLIDDFDESFSKISEDINQKPIVEIMLNNKTKCSVNYINAKLSSIAQGTPLDDYLSNNSDVHKIVIIKEPAKKVHKQIITEYRNAEMFMEHHMMEDIPSKIFIPEHQLLDENEKAELLSKFGENELSIILDTDMMARYFNAKVGDIFRIIRPTITSGTSIFYRRVSHGSLDLIYN